jgi:hypothetical protein
MPDKDPNSLVAGKNPEKIPYSEAVEHFSLNLDVQHVFSFMQTDKFDFTPYSIEHHLGIELGKAVNILEILVVLGAAERSTDGIMKKDDCKLLEFAQSLSVGQFHMLINQVLHGMTNDNSKFDVWTIASRHEIVKKMNEKIARAISEALDQSKNCVPDGIYDIGTIIKRNSIGPITGDTSNA